MPYVFTYMWNLKNKGNKQSKSKQTHRYRKQTDGCQREEGVEGLCEKGEGIKYTFVVTK